jgi:two-component system chemotaxis sensor kinase CheA
MDKFAEKFIEEAAEHIHDIEQNLLLIENEPENSDYIERIFRAMHTLKGGSAMFGFDKISELTHEIENIYDEIRNARRHITRQIIDLTLFSVDHLKLLIKSGNNLSEEILNAHSKIIQQIHELVPAHDNHVNDNHHPKMKITTRQNIPKTAKTYYIYFKPDSDIFDNGTNPLYLIDELVKLGDSIVIPYLHRVPDLFEINPHKCYTYWELILATENQFEEIREVFMFVEDSCKLDIHKISNNNLITHKKFIKRIEKLIEAKREIGLNEVLAIAGEIKESVSQKVKKVLNDTSEYGYKDYTATSVRVSSEKLDRLMNLVSELVSIQARLNLFARKENNNELTTIAESNEKLSRQLRDLVFEIALVPIDVMVTRLQRLVRDLSKELHKDVVFEAHGTETELDKTIIENLTDPLMHIIRNCLDHGIESAERRKMLGKPEKGTILFNAYHSSTNVHIEISDDGAGLDLEKIRRKAVDSGLIISDVGLSEQQIYDLIFLPGFTTVENITDLSGRGVGMDVVKQKIKTLRGEISINSEKNKGTTITLKIPLTLSIIDGLLLKVEDIFYIIPLYVIHKIHPIKHATLKYSYNNQITIDNQLIPYFSLRNIFQLPESDNEDIEHLIIIEYEEQKVGFVVDDIIGEYQAVLKPVGKHYKNHEIISAATILGDGTVALVIDTNRAIKYFNKTFINSEEKL